MHTELRCPPELSGNDKIPDASDCSTRYIAAKVAVAEVTTPMSVCPLAVRSVTVLPPYVPPDRITRLSLLAGVTLANLNGVL